MSYQGRYRTGPVDSSAQKRKWNPNWAKKSPAVARGSLYKPILAPSAQQIAICDDVAHKPDALIVQALAGTGKTATIVEAMRGVVRGKTILYVIFANRNAREAEGKCEERVEVRTCHAFGLAAIKKAFGNKIEVDAKGDKTYNISLALLGPEDEKAELRYYFGKAMDLAKGYLCETPEQVIDVCDKHGIELCGMDEEDFARKVLEGLDLSAKQYMRVEFSDMIWLPVRLNLTIPQFDYVFADESQDLSPARQELVLRAVKPGGKLCAVGDEHQAIFGFTGADVYAMQNIASRTNAHTLPLHTTYRCGKAIVAMAQSYVPEYTAAEQNPEGVVAERTLQDMLQPPEKGGAAPGDFVISRVNAPLVSMCLELIKQGRKASVLGKDLGRNLTYMIKRSKAESVAGFLAWLEDWKNTECDRLVQRNKPCDHIVDKYDCLVAVCEGRKTLDEVRTYIEDMFSDEDEGAKVVFTTAHKAKGLERNRVWLLTYTFKCKGDQEDNVMYVAITRAREELYLVSK
jgi:superfamily I DNA/RNA helicase